MPRLPHRELTPREKIFCRQHYRGTQHCVARISDKLRASRQTVRQALIEMALITEPCTGPRRWAPDEEVQMMELLVDHSIPEVAEFLGRTEGAIIARKRIIDARLRTERGYYTVAETARILGMDTDWVIKHTQKDGLLRAQGRISLYAALSPKLIAEATIRRFLVVHAWKIAHTPHDLQIIVSIVAKRARREP